MLIDINTFTSFRCCYDATHPPRYCTGPVWSGSSKGKVRLNRGGSRSMNCALHMVMVTRARGVGPGRAYIDKQRTRGKDRVAALRLLRHRLSDVVFAVLHADQPAAAALNSEPLRLAA